MIKTRTTFILGAGASMPFGFPSGLILKDWICEVVNARNEIGDVLHGKLALDRDRIAELGRALKRSHINSIDSFLLRRPEFNDIGKFAIAASLCRLENRQNLEDAPDKEHWYRLLWNRMVADTNPDQAESVLANQVRFVSFNYDRSLEYFLFSAVQNTYGLPDSKAYEICRKFGILHVYGQLGAFQYAADEKEGRLYDPELSANRLRIAARGIRLIPEERGDNKDFKLARAWFDWAERICFLGFGFDPVNCENLGLSDVLTYQEGRKQRLPQIYASAKDLHRAEIEEARRRVCGGARGWLTADGDNVHALRSLGVFA